MVLIQAFMILISGWFVYKSIKMHIQMREMENEALKRQKQMDYLNTLVNGKND